MAVKSLVKKTLARWLPSLDPNFSKANLVGKPVDEIFATIYRKKLWGGRLSFGAHSGHGSRNEAIVSPYVSAVRKFLISLNRPSVVDLGCGDFNVGSQLVDCAGVFVGCDVVDFVIEQNRRRFPSVEFRVVNAIDDDLPEGEVVLVRQVLQHLSNTQIAKILPKLSQYKYAVITEHVPGFAGFVPNLDMETGPDQRAGFGSGIVLTEPPFNLQSKGSVVLCEVSEFGGIIRTIVFEF
jgi:hypothetical protein